MEFSSVSPTKLAASDDYATEAWGHSWDFSDSRQYSPELTRSSFVDGGALADGWFTGVTAHGDPKIWLQDITIPGIVPASNEGGSRPIDTTRYRYLSFRMCASANDQAIVYWHKDASFARGSFGSTRFKCRSAPVALPMRSI